MDSFKLLSRPGTLKSMGALNAAVMLLILIYVVLCPFTSIHNGSLKSASIGCRQALCLIGGIWVLPEDFRSAFFGVEL